ncbi:MAG: dockerin type I repeat-containing protein, partial [Clostridia bacterium]|nr:dockerin type I repeat-containing protein [Clostridia bacterium]
VTKDLVLTAKFEDASTILYGDVDGDTKVTAADALEVLKAVVGKVTLTDDQKLAADVDGNGKVDAADALDILKKVVGKIDKFLVEA